MKIATKMVGDGFVRFDFADGESLTCNVGNLPVDIQDNLVIHGIKQKVGDSYAGAESVTEARAMAGDVWKNLTAGIWATKAMRGGKIVEALARATGQPFEDCLEKYMAMSDDEQKALKKHAAIKTALADIDAERARALADAAGDTGDDLTKLFE